MISKGDVVAVLDLCSRTEQRAGKVVKVVNMPMALDAVFRLHDPAWSADIERRRRELGDQFDLPRAGVVSFIKRKLPGIVRRAVWS